MTSSTSGGIGFASALTLIFITLKLLGKISWSWFWILSPLWISFAIGIIILLIMGICALIWWFFK